MANSAFTRRYGYFPGVEVITIIEGIIIVDLPAPGAVQGVGTGVVACVGEFADMTWATSIDSNGNVTTLCTPQQIFSGQDLTNKVGGFDSTIGNFGTAQGNGFVELRNKKFSALVVAPVNLCSSLGARVFRKLPYCTSQTNANPIVPMQPSSVPAATQFKTTGGNRLMTGVRFRFTGNQPYATGTDGSLTASTSATMAFTSASGSFLTVAGPLGQIGVKVGDAIQIGAPVTSASLTVALTSGGATATVASTTGYPGTGLLLIDSEQMTYSGTTATTFTGLTRGVNGTTAAAHSIGVTVNGMNDVDTYRINAVGSATALTLERQDGTNFSANNSFTASALPWRLHVATDADSAGNAAAGAAATQGAYTIPCRPLDATIAVSALLSPTIATVVQTATTWDPQSGMQLLATPNMTGIVYTAAVQAPNAVNSASIDALYTTAISSLLQQTDPSQQVNILFCARTSLNIRNQQLQHVLSQSAVGIGRSAIIWPELSVQTVTAAIAAADPGVGANRNERVDYCWPGLKTFVPEAVNIPITNPLGQTALDGGISTSSAGWLAAIHSNLQPERDPGQEADPVPTVMSPVLAFQDGAPTLGMNEYITLKAQGICAPRRSKTAGVYIFQSSVTTSLTSGQTDQNRRRFADFCEDSLAAALAPQSKLPVTNQFKDTVTGEATGFGEQLLGVGNPQAQRINAYEVDDKTGNTQDLLAQGIYVIIFRVQMTPIAKYIVLQAEVGPGVKIGNGVSITRTA